MSTEPRKVIEKLDFQAALLASRSLKPTAKLVGIRLIIYFNPKTGQCNPSKSTLAKECGISRASAFAALKALVDDDWFARDDLSERDEPSTQYVPNWSKICAGQKIGPRKSEQQNLDSGGANSGLNPSKNQTELVQNPDPNRELKRELNREVKREASNYQCKPDLLEDSTRQPAPSKKQKEPQTKKKARTQSTQIPDNWKLPDDGWSFAASRGFTGDRIEFEIEKFKAYYQGTGKRKANWEATWRSWVLNDTRSSPPWRGQPPTGSSMHDGIDRMNQAMKEKQNEQHSRALQRF